MEHRGKLFKCQTHSLMAGTGAVGSCSLITSLGWDSLTATMITDNWPTIRWFSLLGDTEFPVCSFLYPRLYFSPVGSPLHIPVFRARSGNFGHTLPSLSNFLVAGYAKAVTDFCSSGFLN